jgi:hypothetical protein
VIRIVVGLAPHVVPTLYLLIHSPSYYCRAPAPKKPEKELTEAQKRVLEDYKQKREMEKKVMRLP